MTTVIQVCYRKLLPKLNTFYNNLKPINRTFLSNAYYCNEIWESRLKSEIFSNVNLDELYYELDLRFQKNKNISAVDVDIFANAVKDDTHTDELVDLVHKLRLSADTSNMLESTAHSVIRNLMLTKNHNRLLEILDDRLNYGIFLDHFTANILLDTFWKNKDYISGAKVATQLMLQEDFSHPFSTYLSLLHCYKYLSVKPEGWIVEEPPADTTEEVKIRVKFLRNPFFDDHFDLREPNHLVGKTLWLAGSVNDDAISRTLQIIGLEIYEKHDEAKKLVNNFASNNKTVIKDGLNLLPEDNEVRKLAEELNFEDGNTEKLLEGKVKIAERENTEKDIDDQCKLYDEWDKKRMEALQKQQERYNIAERLANIEELQENYKEKEMKLWFFDREEQLELDIEAKKVYYPKRWFGKKKKPRKIEEGYIPPEVKTAYKTNK